MTDSDSGLDGSNTPRRDSLRSLSAGAPALSDLLVGTRRYFTRGTVSDDLRTLTKRGGRQADVFYRDRWRHDKVVRSTHGVNCSGSCSW